MARRPLVPRWHALVLALTLLIPLIPGQALAGRTGVTAAPPSGMTSLMAGGNTVGGQVREKKPRADGHFHVDTPGLIKRIKATNANTYTFGIWESTTDWDDLVKEFTPAAKRAGIKIRVYLVPPSECSIWADNAHTQMRPPHTRGRCSWPHREDYVEWAKTVARLSKQYGNITSWAIDDFYLGNQWKFTKQYMAEMKKAQDEINPDLPLYTTAYFGDAVDDKFYELYGEFIDGIIYPYLGRGDNTMEAAYVEENLDRIRTETQPRNLDLILLVYSGRFLASSLNPTDEYVSEVFDRAKPYAADGRIAGVIAYGLPVDGMPHMSSEHKAAKGDGWLSMHVQVGRPTNAGASAGASQTVKVDGNAAKHTLSFSHIDDYGRIALAGYHKKQILIDGKVAWQADIADEPENAWKREAVDLSEQLRGKESAELTLRLFQEQGVTDYPVERAGFDDLEASGFTVGQPGFEGTQGWKLNSTQPGRLMTAVDVYKFDLPNRIFNTVAKKWGGSGMRWPAPARPKLGPANRAMYGNGRLRLSAPDGKQTKAGTCASATQNVRVQQNLPRYDISLWNFDQYENTPKYRDFHYKVLTIDGKPVWRYDVADWNRLTWTDGQDWQGIIDITEFVKGKEKVDLGFKLCAQRETGDLPVEVGIDNIRSAGLAIKNPGFETREHWKLASDHDALRAQIAIAR